MDSLLDVVSKATEILETMDDCVVALKSAKLLKRAMDRARSKFTTSVYAASPGPTRHEPGVFLNHYWGPLNLIDGDMSLDFSFQFDELDGNAQFFEQ
jgi:hypothetical protein